MVTKMSRKNTGWEPSIRSSTTRIFINLRIVFRSSTISITMNILKNLSRLILGHVNSVCQKKISTSSKTFLKKLMNRNPGPRLNEFSSRQLPNFGSRLILNSIFREPIFASISWPIWLRKVSKIKWWWICFFLQLRVSVRTGTPPWFQGSRIEILDWWILSHDFTLAAEAGIDCRVLGIFADAAQDNRVTNNTRPVGIIVSGYDPKLPEIILRAMDMLLKFRLHNMDVLGQLINQLQGAYQGYF